METSTNSIKNKAPTWKLGTQKRKGLHHSGKTPGPGTYESDNKKKGPTYVMGMKTKVDFSKLNPGPGTYSTSDLLGVKGKGYTFGGKKQFSQTGKQFPGPGTYDIRSTIPTKQRGKSFGKERRASSYERGSPGPGQYSISTTNTKMAAPKYGFGSGKRDSIKGHGESPGPGTYNQKVHGKTAPRGLVLPRRPESAPAKGRGTPGPGQYNENLYIKKSAPKYGMGTGAARSSINKDRLQSPGPNKYDPSRNQTMHKNPTWKIGTDKRRPMSARNGTPGPGNYTITSRKSGPAYGMRGRNVTLQGTNTPGPGQYRPRPETVRTSGPKCKIGTESRDGNLTSKKTVPGPGQYNNPKTKLIKSSPSFGFGTGKRGNTSKQGSPGPGHYHIPCKVADVPRYQNTKQPEEFRFI